MMKCKCLQLLAGPQAVEGELHTLHIDALGEDARADVGRDVVAKGAAQVVNEVGQWALAGCLCLQRKANKCHHGQARCV